MEVRAAIADEFAKPSFRSLSLLTLGLAPRPASCFRRVKADQANVRSAVIQAYGIAIDDRDGNRRSRGNHRCCWRRKRRHGLFARNLGRELNGSVTNETAGSD
jgi:hypothetical protein